VGGAPGRAHHAPVCLASHWDLQDAVGSESVEDLIRLAQAEFELPPAVGPSAGAMSKLNALRMPLCGHVLTIFSMDGVPGLSSGLSRAL
jgi:hypothetical protein